MAEIYSDIDLSLNKNLRGDFSKLININSVRQALFNRLMIPSEEMPFDSSGRQTLRDFVHSTMTNSDKKSLRELIDTAIFYDDRISDHTIDIQTSENGHGSTTATIKVYATIVSKDGSKESTTITLVVESK